MQFYSPQQSNPKRREKRVTNFSNSQKGYDFLRNHLRVWNSDVMLAVYKTLCHSAATELSVPPLIPNKTLFFASIAQR
jgi:hypothetical protein